MQKTKVYMKGQERTRIILLFNFIILIKRYVKGYYNNYEREYILDC